MSEAITPHLSHSRRLAREVAFQALYMQRVGHLDMATATQTACGRHQLSDAAREFVELIVQGINKTYEELDAHIDPLLADGWTLDRIAISDLIALQIAAYELFHIDDMPPKVTISQAVELSKRFGAVESGRFVNGVLGNLLGKSPKAEWESPIIVDPVDEEDNTIILVDPDEEQPEQPIEDGVSVGSWVIKAEPGESDPNEPL